MAAEKTPCTLSRDHFLANAKPLVITIMGVTFSLQPREFSTGSFGWYHSGKVDASVAGEEVRIQLSINATVANSKEAPRSNGHVEQPIQLAS